MVNNLIENNICFVLSLETNRLLRECVNQKREKRIYLVSSNVFCRLRTSLLRKECKSLEPGWMHHRLDLAFVGIHTCSSRTRTPNVHLAQEHRMLCLAQKHRMLCLAQKHRMCYLAQEHRMLHLAQKHRMYGGNKKPQFP